MQSWVSPGQPRPSASSVCNAPFLVVLLEQASNQHCLVLNHCRCSFLVEENEGMKVLVRVDS